MTQLNGSERAIFGHPMNTHHSQHSAEPRYYVNEPLGKRPACHHAYSDILEGAPRAKRRIEKVNSYLQNLSLAQGTVNPINLESSSDEEMLDEDLPTCSANAIVEEPDDAKSIKLENELIRYIELCKKQPENFLSKLNGPPRGDELTIWRPPTSSRLESDSLNMAGRIHEIEDDEELPDEIDDVSVSFPDDTSSELSPYSRSSLSTSPPQIVELTDSSASSPVHIQENIDYEMDTD